MYFKALLHREPDTDHYYDWLCTVLKVTPPEEHPAPTPVTRLLGQVAEDGIEITSALLAVWDKAAHFNAHDARMFIDGAFTMAGIETPIPAPVRVIAESDAVVGIETPSPAPVRAIADSDDDTASYHSEPEDPPQHFKGTINNEIQYWRQDSPGQITHLYEKKDIDSAGHVPADITVPHGFYISDHINTRFVAPPDTVGVSLVVSGFYATETKALLIFPSAATTPEQQRMRVSGIIEALMARGERINRDLIQWLPSMSLKRIKSAGRDTCGLCGLNRALTHKAGAPGMESFQVGSRCAEQLDLAIRLSKLAPGEPPDALLSKLGSLL